MKLLVEEINEAIASLQEESGKKRWMIEGKTLQAVRPNKNGRSYPKHILESEVARYTKDYIDTKRAWGELGHPQGPKINEDRISHRFVSLTPNGNDYIGKAIIAEGTQKGDTLIGLLNTGGSLGISSRGTGSLRLTNGLNEVQNDYRMATAGDVVIDPSAHDAFVSALMESVEWICEGGVWRATDIEQAQADVNAAAKAGRLTEEVQIGILKRFFESL